MARASGRLGLSFAHVPREVVAVPGPEFVRVAALTDVPVGSVRSVKLRLKEFALFNVGGRIIATRGTCPHQQSSLALGRVCGDEITCARHGWRFRISTGEPLPPSGTWARLDHYAIAVEGGEIYLAPDRLEG